MPRYGSELGSPTGLARTGSIRKLTDILRPTRRTPAQPSLLVPESESTDSATPPSSPSLYSPSSENETRAKPYETDRSDSRPPDSPTLSTLSVSVSGGDGGPARTPSRGGPLSELTPPGLESLSSMESSLPTRRSRRPQRASADFSWAMNTEHRVRPQRIIIADKEDAFQFINSDASSLRAAGRWGEQPPSPSEWLSPKNVFLGLTQLSPIEAENRSPSSSSGSSPATPRPRPTDDMHRPHLKPGLLDTSLNIIRSPTITEAPSPDARRRPRSASEPRLFLDSPIQAPHAGTVPSTPTGYIFTVPASVNGALDVDSGLESSPPPPSPTSPKSPRTSLNYYRGPMPEDVYFTAAGRRESRMYISPDAAPNQVPLGPRSSHSYTNSEPPPSAHPDELDPNSTSVRYATWNNHRRREGPTKSGRPFEDAIERTSEEGDSFHMQEDRTPVTRREEMWSGEWNREDIQEVIRELRALRG